MSPNTQMKICPAYLATPLFMLCFCVYATAMLGRMSYSAIMAELIASEGFTKSQAGLIGTTLFLTYGLGQIFSGLLGDRISPRKMVLFGIVGSAVANILMGFLSTYTAMLPLWLINGIFQACMWPPISRMFALVLPPDYRRKACANIAITAPLSTGICYAMAALFLRIASWRLVFWISGAAMLVVAVVWQIRLLAIERETEEKGTAQELSVSQGEGERKSSLLQVVVMSGVVFALLGAVTQGLVRDGIQTWTPSFMGDQFGYGTSFAVALSVFLPLLNIAGVFVTKALTPVIRRNDFRATAIFFGTGAALLLVLLPVSARFGALSLVLLALISTCTIGGNIILINTLPMAFGRYGYASSVTGIVNCSAYVGSAISSYGIGWIADAAGWGAAIIVWLVFCAAAAISALLGAKRWKAFVQLEGNP